MRRFYLAGFVGAVLAVFGAGAWGSDFYELRDKFADQAIRVIDHNEKVITNVMNQVNFEEGFPYGDFLVSARLLRSQIEHIQDLAEYKQLIAEFGQWTKPLERVVKEHDMTTTFRAQQLASMLDRLSDEKLIPKPNAGQALFVPAQLWLRNKDVIKELVSAHQALNDMAVLFTKDVESVKRYYNSINYKDLPSDSVIRRNLFDRNPRLWPPMKRDLDKWEIYKLYGAERWLQRDLTVNSSFLSYVDKFDRYAVQLPEARRQVQGLYKLFSDYREAFSKSTEYPAANLPAYIHAPNLKELASERLVDKMQDWIDFNASCVNLLLRKDYDAARKYGELLKVYNGSDLSSVCDKTHVLYKNARGSSESTAQAAMKSFQEPIRNAYQKLKDTLRN